MMNSTGDRNENSYENLKTRGYKAGSIVRIKVKNFCTFDECEIFPGPKLNIVIGPNGTGKSALTHAICLACAGKADDTGRSNNISAFVKIGSKGESFTEVDILSFDKTIKTIRREINGENKASKWFLDGKKATQIEVKQLVTKLQIDVDNLCSFMPQDRVGEFSRATPNKLLENTLMALENIKEFEISLIKEQTELSNIQGSKDSLLRDRHLKQTQLDANRNELAQLRSEMDRMQRREDAIKLKSFYEVKLTKLELDQAAIDLENKEKEVVAAEAQKLVEEAKLGPLQIAVREAQKNSSLYDQAINGAAKKYQELNKTIRSVTAECAEFEIQLDTASANLRFVDEKKKENDDKLQAARIELRTAQQREIEANDQIPILQEDILKIDANINVCNDNFTQVTNEVNKVHQQTLQLMKQGQDLTTELGNLQDFRENYKKFLENHRKKNRNMTDALSAMTWFQNNEEQLRNSNKIKGEVFGPVAMYCDVADPHCVAMIESMVPENRLLGFVVQYQSDRDILKREFTSLNYTIDVVVMENAQIDNSKVFSNSQLEQLRDINIQGYLSDQIKCPDTIRSYLYIFHNVQHAIWAQPNQFVTSLSPHQINSLVSGQHKSFKLFVHNSKDDNSVTVFNGNTSRYQSGIITNKRNVGSKGIITSRKQSSDNVEDKRKELSQRIERSRRELSEKEGELRKLKIEQQNINAKIQKYTNDRNLLRNKIKTFKGIKETVASKTRRVAELEKKFMDGGEKEKQQAEAEYRKAVQTLFRGIQNIADTVEKSNDILIEKAVYDKLKSEIEERNFAITEQYELAKRELANIVRELALKKRARDDYRKRQENKETELEQSIQEKFSISFEEFIDSKLEEMHQLCPEDTLDAVVARVFVLTKEIDRIVDNPLLKDRFERLRIEVSSQEKQLEELTKQCDSQEDIFQVRAERWLRIVNGCVTKLNELFRKYMQDLNFDGEVLLRNKGFLKDYELQLRVTFRAESDMCDLDGHRHSGGERAVSTAMFLMALQDMTSSPFRVVDEINQGMDENNERLVFDRIVTSCVGDETRPQYFVATPKLLQSLNPMVHKDVTILLVLNGPGTSDKWDFHGKLLEIKRKAATAAIVEEDSDEDNEQLSTNTVNQIRPNATVKKLRT